MFPIHTILHPTDFSERSGYAFDAALELAKDYKARLILLHVAQPPAPVPGAPGAEVPSPEDYRQALATKLHWLKVPDNAVEIEPVLKEGDPAPEILRTVEAHHCDLVVMGTHGRTGLDQLRMGSVAAAVLQNAPCPVLMVREPLSGGAPEPSAASREAVMAG
jgi:nucleotide-binding universal stress UspA family protein